MRTLLFCLAAFGLGVLHFFAGFMLTFITGTTESGNKILVFLARAFTFPLSVLPLGNGDNLGIWAWVLWFGQSLLWGVAVLLILRAFLTRHTPPF